MGMGFLLHNLEQQNKTKVNSVPETALHTLFLQLEMILKKCPYVTVLYMWFVLILLLLMKLSWFFFISRLKLSLLPITFNMELKVMVCRFKGLVSTELAD